MKDLIIVRGGGDLATGTIYKLYKCGFPVLILEAEKPSGKTYAFYLSDDNVAKLKKMAEKKKISASKLLDHILSEVL